MKERHRPEKSLVQVLVFEKTSLQGHTGLVTVGLSLTAARLVKGTTVASRRETGCSGHQSVLFCFYGWRLVSGQLIAPCCERENSATKGLSGNVELV